MHPLTKNTIKSTLQMLNSTHHFIDLEAVARTCEMKVMQLYDLITHTPGAGTGAIQDYLEATLEEMTEAQVKGFLEVGKAFGLANIQLWPLPLLSAKISIEYDRFEYNLTGNESYKRWLERAAARELGEHLLDQKAFTLTPSTNQGKAYLIGELRYYPQIENEPGKERR